MIIPQSQIIGELAELGIFPEGLNDSMYFCPSVEWLDEYLSWFWKDNPYRYKKDKYDCDNFARRAWVKADESLQENNDIQDADHTFGLAKLALQKGLNGIPGNTLHATNICRCSNNIWYFCEPQTAQKHEVKTALADGLCSAPWAVWL